VQDGAHPGISAAPLTAVSVSPQPSCLGSDSRRGDYQRRADGPIAPALGAAQLANALARSMRRIRRRSCLRGSCPGLDHRTCRIRQLTDEAPRSRRFRAAITRGLRDVPAAAIEAEYDQQLSGPVCSEPGAESRRDGWLEARFALEEVTLDIRRRGGSAIRNGCRGSACGEVHLWRRADHGL